MIAALSFALLVSSSTDVRVVVAPPCLATFRASSRVGSIAYQDAKRTGNKVSTRALGPAGLADDERIVVPDPEALDTTAPARVVAAAGVERTVVAAHLPALRTPEELTFALPGAPEGYLHHLAEEGAARGRSPDIEETEVRLVREKKGSASVLVVEIPRPDGTLSSSASTDPLDYERAFVGFDEVGTPGGTVTLVTCVLIVGGPARLKVALDDARARAGEGALTVMPGGVAGYVPRADACASVARAVAPDVIVPGPFDLALGHDAFDAWRQKAGHPVVAAANLAAAPPKGGAKDARGAKDFDAVVERDVDGVRVAVIGLVNPAALERAPPELRASWRVDDPIAAAYDVVGKEMLLPRPPDLVVVITASRDLLPKLAGVPGVDVVVAGGEGRTDALDVVTRAVPQNAREGVREPGPMLAVLGDAVAVRTVTARFEPARGEPPRAWRLAELEDAAPPVDGWSPRDVAFARPFRVAEERDWLHDAPPLLPKLDDVLAHAKGAAALARGQDIAYRGGFVTVAPDDPPIWSDALFHRLAANAVNRALGVDAAFTATTPRRSDLGNAAVSRGFVRDWLSGKGALIVVELRGDVLLRLAQAVARQASSFPPSSWIYASAVDPARGVVGGRKIDPAVTYRVALDAKSAARGDVAALLDKQPAHKRFAVTGDARWRVEDGPSGAALAASAAVLAVLERADQDARKIGALLDDEATVVEPEWRFSVAGLDVHGTGGRSSDNIAPFALTKEARAAQPAFSQIGVHAELQSLYDSASFAWESRLKLHYESILLVDVPGSLLQDQVDDAVLSTEGRLNSISIHGDAGDFRIVPFGQLAVDSEITPTQVPVDASDPQKGFTELPRQWLFRESAGIAAFPGNWVKEVRLGAILQHDASEAFDHGGPVRNDVGAGLEWHILVPLWKLAFTSDVDARYFIPDGDDLESDLALRAQAVHRLALPVTPTTSVFVFFDTIFLVGKKPPLDQLGWNAIAGGGITFADTWRF